MRAAARLATALAILLATAVSASAQGEIVEYYGLDALGSVRVVFDATGNVVGRMDYGPFGQELFGGTNMPDRRYAGLFRDGEAGLDSAGARSYQSRTGRFTTVDPVFAGLFEPQGWNRYAYALNSPISFSDAAGLQADAGKPCGETVWSAEKWSWVISCPNGSGSSSGGGMSFEMVWWMTSFMAFGGTGGAMVVSSEGGAGWGQNPTAPAQSPVLNIPELPKGTPEEFKKPFSDAFTEAEKRLEKKKCGDFYGGAETARQTLEGAEYRFIDLGRPTFLHPTVSGAATQRSANRVIINTNGPFLPQNVTQVILGLGPRLFDFDTGLRGPELGAAILLHELGHLTGKFGLDAGDPDKNLTYTRSVLRVCF